MNDKLGAYEHIPNDEDDTRNGRKLNRMAAFLRVCCFLALFSLAVFIGIAAEPARHTMSLWLASPKITYCGRTSSEAQARGCVLEPMLYGWMPPQCQFPEVTSYNDPFKEWTWYADENLTQPLTEEQLWNGKSIELWTDVLGFHTEHCLFLYRKLMYAMENRARWLDKKTLGSEHAYHCVEQLSAGRESGNGSTYAMLGMYTCKETPWS